ncbi:TonB family protein [Halomonas sp. KAO]|uniref:TonB family protein n=1 Tax=Halomonas sp. KAO TaxID=2783858 RepID=UPI00189FB357|nr:TonB family protein [Halomonas sp. KAO]MBF7053789.1 TonB family protein [Halomonas sp. KAO]
MTLAVGDPIQYAPVTRSYRRWLAWSLALLLHLALIGVVASWQFAAPPPERSSLDVVLVTRPAEAPVNAEAIAETGQQAAGTQQEEAPAESRSAPVEAPATAQQGGRDVDPATPAPPESAERVTPEAPSVEEAPSVAESEAESPMPPTPREAPQTAAAEAEPRVATPTGSGRDLLADATRSIREQGLAPASPGLDSATPRQAAQRAAEARYIDDWTRRVEAYGNRVHPAPRHLQGQLRIRVVVGRGGELRQAEVVQSSGHPELDQAALDTVHGAAPYRPFDAGMGNLDTLSITRVWRFGQGNNYGVR